MYVLLKFNIHRCRSFSLLTAISFSSHSDEAGIVSLYSQRGKWRDQGMKIRRMISCMISHLSSLTILPALGMQYCGTYSHFHRASHSPWNPPTERNDESNAWLIDLYHQFSWPFSSVAGNRSHGYLGSQKFRPSVGNTARLHFCDALLQ